MSKNSIDGYGELLDSLPLIIKNVRRSLEYECYLSALALVLTIPDICGKAEFSNMEKVGDRYREWVDKWITSHNIQEQFKDIPYIDGKLIYKLRCAFLHSGRDDIENEQFDYNLDNFILKIESKKEFDNYVSSAGIITDNDEKTYSYIRVDIRDLCRDITSAAEVFMKKRNDLSDKLPKIRILDWNKEKDKFDKLMKRDDNYNFLADIGKKTDENN